MIHRFVDLLEEVELDRAMIWNVKQSTGGTDRLFALGIPGSTTADYLGQSRVNVNQWTIDRPVLSPDLSEYVYTETDTGAAGTNRTRLRRCASDDGSAPVTLAETPSSGAAASGRLMEICGWSPDGTKVYYRGQTTTLVPFAPGEIRRVNRDGTGNTQLWTNINIFAFQFGIYPRVSPDGTMIAWWIDNDNVAADAGLWVMNEDGTGVSQIHVATGGGLPDDFYGWSPDSEWLLFRDTDGAPTPDEASIFKIRPDGSDETQLALTQVGVDPAIFVSQGQYSVWLEDASAIVCSQESGTPGNGDIGFLLTDGSGTFTPISPTREVDYVAYYSDGPILNSNYRRIYWYKDAALGVGNMQVVSAKIDGSDYRVDDDQDTDPTHDDYESIGFYRRST